MDRYQCIDEFELHILCIATFLGAFVQVIEPVLAIAASLSVQSPFNRAPLGQSDINVSYRTLLLPYLVPIPVLQA